MVAAKYKTPTTTKLDPSPTYPTSRPPKTPPSGINDQASALLRAVTRPTSGLGIRSNWTAPRTGLRKPDVQPPTTHTARIAQRGTPSANSTNRGSPVTRKATTYVAKRGRRVPQVAAITEPTVDAPAHTENTIANAPTPAPDSRAQTGRSTADHARSSRFVTATITHRPISTW